jgi:hypothetical protein
MVGCMGVDNNHCQYIPPMTSFFTRGKSTSIQTDCSDVDMTSKRCLTPACTASFDLTNVNTLVFTPVALLGGMWFTFQWRRPQQMAQAAPSRLSQPHQHCWRRGGGLGQASLSPWPGCLHSTLRCLTCQQCLQEREQRCNQSTHILQGSLVGTLLGPWRCLKYIGVGACREGCIC